MKRGEAPYHEQWEAPHKEGGVWKSNGYLACGEEAALRGREGLRLFGVESPTGAVLFLAAPAAKEGQGWPWVDGPEAGLLVA